MKSQRHQLIFPKTDASIVLHSNYKENEALKQQVTNWINQGLPCLYARQLCQDGVTLNLGLPVLWENKKYRVGFSINKKEIKNKEELPLFVDMAGFIAKKIKAQPVEWFSKQDLTDFQSISVYGSFLMEYLSSQPFVHHDSDLDLLIEYEQGSLVELNQRLIKIKNKFSIPIDGEVRFQNLGDISFKELMEPSAKQLLFKNSDEIGLISRHDLYKQYPDLF